MITNRSEKRVRRPLPIDMTKLYYPEVGDWSYSHHASICKYHNTFYAMWSNGKVDEDAVGQRVLYSTSANGTDWSTPAVLFTPLTDDGVMTAAGFYAGSEALVAYAGYFAYKDITSNDNEAIYLTGHKDTTLFCKYTVDGQNWSAPRDMKLPLVPNHGPQRTTSGRLIISGNIMFPYSDNRDGIHDWELTGTTPFPWHPLYDDSEGFEVRARNDGTPWVCEGSFFETDDGVLHMLQRSADKVLYVSESTDNGTNWSASRKTEFTDSCSKFHCGRLPDGKHYIISNPDPASSRCPLILSISRDGADFDREYIIDDRFFDRRIPGHSKGGIYGYPHSIVDGYIMYVICSMNKEDVNLYRINLNNIIDN